jgi:hypothetical protein
MNGAPWSMPPEISPQISLCFGKVVEMEDLGNMARIGLLAAVVVGRGT